MTAGRARWSAAGTAAVIALVVLAVEPAYPFGKNKINYENFRWQIYPTAHFDIYYYPEGESRLPFVVSSAESAYDKLSKALDHDINFRIPLIVYKTHSDFQQTNVTLSMLPGAVAAFAEPFENRIVLPIDDPPDQAYELIVHELTHIFEYSILFNANVGRALTSNPPLWLMEGLAEYMAGSESRFNEMVVRDAVVHNIIPPITRLGGLSFLTYRFGQVAFEFIEQEFGSEGVRTFLWEYRKVLRFNNLEKAIKESFGISAEEFDRQFKRYLQRRYLPELLTKDEPFKDAKEIGVKDLGVFTFSPTLSPSGELVAVLSNKKEELDVLILSVRDGKVLRNITKGFTRKYEEINAAVFTGKRDLDWAPGGDRIAFFARRENAWPLFVYNALNGKLIARYDPGVDEPTSPAFSPDGSTLLFAGNRDGINDIFALDLDTEAVRNITDDDFFDSNPRWSEDGESIVYNRRIGGFEKLFLVDPRDTERKIQLTFGPANDIMPSFSRDGKRIYYSSDGGPDDGIFNIYSLDLETGAARQYTDVIGGNFAPVEFPSESAGKVNLVFSSYYAGRYRLFRTSIEDPEPETSAEELSAEPIDLTPFAPPLNVPVDDAQKRPYKKLDWHIESTPDVVVGLSNDGTFLSDTQLVFADILGDHRINLIFSSISTFSNFDVSYVNLKRRYNWAVRAIDFRTFFISTFTGERIEQVRRETGAQGIFSYPFNRYFRFEATAGYFTRSLPRPIFARLPVTVIDEGGNVTTEEDILFGFVEFDENFPVATVSFSGDTVRFKPWGPYNGYRFNFSVNHAPVVSGDRDEFTNFLLDFRGYRRVTRNSLFAMRLYGFASEGEAADITAVGGINTIRGFDFFEFFGDHVGLFNLEFRFPLVNELAMPWGSIGPIRGFLFLDVGTAFIKQPTLFNAELEPIDELPTQFFEPAISDFKDYNFFNSEQDRLEDGKSSVGAGLSLFFGPVQLNWAFAQRWNFDELEEQWRSSFYMAFDF